jgi:NAD(P)-dependent dehydrogenase (short-subunit alcohol dehydrogenase family)
VTGGTGWIGSLCIIELLRRGYTVRTTARSLDKEPVVRAQISTIIDPGERLSFFVADLTNDAGWDVAVAVCEYALHRLLVNCLLFLRELAGRAHNEIDLIVERFPLYECGVIHVGRRGQAAVAVAIYHHCVLRPQLRAPGREAFR